MANIMQMFQAKNKVNRNSFALEKKVAFTAKAGELLPIYSRICMPGDRFDIRTAWKTRTAPVNTAAFTLFREYYDWYFVPLNLLWNKYNTWSTNMKKNNMVATSINGTTELTDVHPYFSSGQISTLILKLGSAKFPTASTKYNQFGYSRGDLACKLLHLLGYGDFYMQDSSTQPFQQFIQNFNASPWRLLAYQKIYQDWYRNTQWEASRPETCNIDYIDGSSESLQIPLGDMDLNKVTMFDLQYANWNKDMFMGVLPNSQYGDTATIWASDDFYEYEMIDGRPVTTQTPVYAGPTRTRPDGRVVGNLHLGSVKADQQVQQRIRNSTLDRFNILVLRQAEAYQKFREIQQSNSQDFPSQTDAHFGHRPNNAYSSRCIRIGGFDGNIEIQDIDNTNITENEDGSMNGADIAGKALVRGQGNLNDFVADVPGIIMCIYHVKPLLDYASSGIAPDNLKTKFTDYAIPELDQTGMVQVPLIMLTNRKDGWTTFNIGNGLLGYAPNYFDYKTDIDTVHGAFYNGGLESWVAPITKNYINSFLRTSQSVNGETLTYTGINYNFFKINPSVLDSIFAKAADSNVMTDTFWVNCYHDIKAVRPLDVNGLPF